MSTFHVVVDVADETTVEVQHVDMPAVEVGIPGTQGPQGDPGPPGQPGPPGAPSMVPGPEGDSAYEVWLGEGNTGSEQDFLDSLVGPPGGSGNVLLEAQWNYNSTNFTGPPASGQVRFNSANLALATQMFIYETDRNGVDRSVEMDLAASQPGSTLYVRDAIGATATFLADEGTDNGTWRTTQLTPLGGATSLRSTVWITIVAAGSTYATVEYVDEAVASVITVAPTPPSDPDVGDLWVDSH